MRIFIKYLKSTMPECTLDGFDIGYSSGCISNFDRTSEIALNQQIFGDIRKFLENLFDNVGAVINLAAISSDPIGNLYEKVTSDINYIAGMELARKAKMAGVKRFVFASSCSIYGSAEDSSCTEDSTLNPLTAYARSKVDTENDLKTLADDHLQATCLRFSTACGWSDRLRLDLVLNDFVACAVSIGEITILSDGDPWRPLINVRDMAKAIEWAINRENDNGGSFLAITVGSDEWNYQVKELAETVKKVIPDVKLSINPIAQPNKRSYRVSFERFRKLAPNHQPTVDLIESIHDIRAGLDRIKFNQSDLRNSDFIRLKHLTRLQQLGLINDNLEWN